MKIEILRNRIVHGAVSAKKGDILQVPKELGEAWVKAGYAKPAPDSAKVAATIA